MNVACTIKQMLAVHIIHRLGQKSGFMKRMWHKETNDNLNSISTAPKYIDSTTITFYNTYNFSFVQYIQSLSLHQIKDHIEHLVSVHNLFYLLNLLVSLVLTDIFEGLIEIESCKFCTVWERLMLIKFPFRSHAQIMMKIWCHYHHPCFTLSFLTMNNSSVGECTSSFSVSITRTKADSIM